MHGFSDWLNALFKLRWHEESVNPCHIALVFISSSYAFKLV